MNEQTSYLCRQCGQQHEGLPFSYGFHAPAYWSDTNAADEHSGLDEEQCIIEGQHFFVRARIVIPVTDIDAEFDWASGCR